MRNLLAQSSVKFVPIPVLLAFAFMAKGQEPLRRFFQPPNVVNAVPYGANPAAGKYAHAGDAKIYYEVYGKGQPIVLLHGGLFGATIEMAELIDKLKPNFRVIAISTRGHGKSEIGREPLTLEQRANDAMAVIQAETQEKVTIIGFSDGGYAAYKFGAMFPERVRKMVVIGAGALFPGLRDFKFDVNQALAMDTLYWKQQLKLMPEPNRLGEVFAQVSSCYSKVTVGEELLRAIKCPVLVMAGDRDDGNSVENVVKAARMIKNSQISIIPNGTHPVLGDNFEAVWASIAPFLGKPDAPYLPLTKEVLEPHQVSFSFAEIAGFKAVQAIKDPTVKEIDEPTFVKIKGVDFKNGEIELKVLSRLLPNAPDFARGFIGIAFRINEDNSKFESIYIRPTNGRAAQQTQRNHSIQYFSYPDFKFDRLRKESPEAYESYADMGLNEWITLKIVVNGSQATLYLNDNPQPSLLVGDLKLGPENSGSIGLWVEVGTMGFFRDLKITPY